MVEVYDIALATDELHESLGRGFPKGAFVLIEGAETTGKSVLCQRLLYGLLAHNYTITMISTELTVKEFVNQMYSIAYKIATPLLRGNMLYLPVYPLMKKIKPIQNFVRPLMTTEAIFKNDIIVIDTLSSMLKNTPMTKDTIVDLLSFFKRLSALKKTVIVTVDPAELSPDILAPLRAAAHVYLDLKITMIGGYVTRQIFVKRFSQTENPVEDVVGFRIEPGIGFIVEITRYA